LNTPADHPFRSLVTTLRAAEKSDKAHLSIPEVARLIDNAMFFYVEGYFLTNGLDCALEIAKKASESGKVRSCLAFDGTRCAPCSFSPRFSPYLSAPFIPQFFEVQLEQIFTYCDYVISNESEAAAWASAVGLPDKDDIPAIASSIAKLSKSNPLRSRTVIITQGPNSTVAVSAADPDNPKVFPITRLEMDKLSIPTALAMRLQAVSWVPLFPVKLWMRPSLQDIN
jgi:adenosine kinase